MNKQLLEVYALSVCFVSIGCLSIFTGIFLYSLVGVSFPSTMNSPRMYQPPPVVIHNGMVTSPLFAEQSLSGISSAEVIANNVENNHPRQASQKQFEELAAKQMKTESIMSMVRSAIIVLIASIVFVFHWRIAKQARSSKALE